MTYRNDNYGNGYAVAGYANSPTKVPFVELVTPFMYIGEEVVRFGTAAVAATFRVAAAFMRWRNERATMRALGALEDHILKDIGVSRGEIPAIARKVANG